MVNLDLAGELFELPGVHGAGVDLGGHDVFLSWAP